MPSNNGMMTQGQQQSNVTVASSSQFRFLEIGPNDLKFQPTVDKKTNQQKQVFILARPTRMPMISIIVFKNDGCPHCPKMIKLMSQVCSHQLFLGKVGVFLYDVRKTPQHFGFVKETNKANNVIKIAGIPMTIVFVQGVPSNVYSLSGKDDVQKFASLLMGLLKKLKMVSPSAPKKPHILDEVGDVIQQNTGSIPYNIVCDDNMCYMSTSEIFGGEEICSDGVCSYKSTNEILGNKS